MAGLNCLLRNGKVFADDNVNVLFRNLQHGKLRCVKRKTVLRRKKVYARRYLASREFRLLHDDRDGDIIVRVVLGWIGAEHVSLDLLLHVETISIR